MKLTRCDICGTLEGGQYFRLDLPEGVSSIELYPHDVCEGCAKRLSEYLADAKKIHRMGVTRL